ncbi:amino acid adenylation domain-containing protein [Nocardia lijiangensis]|uniref:amino acid adenylation domain-containing protein n=1 Tax=Nocardia lijiangensis TaxID=299618 RepID=UPI003D73BB77
MRQNGEFPLSPAQLGMWYAQQLDPSVPLNEAQYIEMRGPLDIDTLVEVARRAALETESALLRFGERDSRPYQVVDPSLDTTLSYLDLSDSADPDAEAMRWMRADLSAPVDLLRDRPGISVLIRVAPDRVLWYSRVHHVVVDGFATVTGLYRVAELYNAALAGEEPKPSSAAGLREIHDAEMSYRESSRFTADAEYWEQRMADMPQRCSLVAGAAPAHALGREHMHQLPDEVKARLDAAATRFGVGAPALAMAALAVYYAQATGAHDVVLSLPVSGRTTAMLRRSGGMLANVVPLRVTVGERSTLAEIVDAIRIEVSGALRHQRYRHEEIRQSTGEAEATGGRGLVGPVVNIMLFPGEVQFTGIETSLHVLTSGPIEDLFVNIYQHGAQAPVHLDFTANPDLYDEESLGRHHLRFLKLFEGLLDAEPDTPVRDIEYFLDDELPLRAGVRGPMPPAPRLLSDVLDEGLRAAGPGAAAVVDGPRTVTYGALDSAAAVLAGRLAERGAGPDDAVLVALPRSVESVLAFWGVVRSGAAYVPVGTGNPAERVAKMAAECGARLGITTRDQASLLPDSVAWIEIDTDAPLLDALAPSGAHGSHPEAAAEGDSTGFRPRGEVRLDHTAYVVFTSGSTGVPKGVVVTHAGIAGLAAAVREAYRPEVGSRVLHCLNPSFDASLLELLIAFGTGATMVIGRGESMAGAELTTAVADFGITQVCSTPAVLATLPEGALDGVLAVSTGGEICPPELVARFGPGRRLVNSYGPSETTVAATFTGPMDPQRPSGIGRPVPGARLMVLDRRLRPVPIGTPGELYIGGPGVARGYAGRQGLTADRLVADPFGPRGSRMYRTGDLVCWRSVEPFDDAVRASSDGVVLEYLGRSDFQVKLRGMRVEPGEVDAVLDSHPEVEIAVTVVRTGASGRAMLASYVVPVHRDSQPTELDVPRLREFCMRRLPGHMVPGTITVLDALPLTGNGKVDRRALPEPAVEAAPRTAATEVEGALCALFAEVLGVPAVGADVSFFALGGDSILSIQLVARGRAAGLVFSARDVFEHPTPAALAAVVTAPGERAVLDELPGGGVGFLPRTPIVDWLLEQPGWQRFSQSMVLALPAGLSESELARTLGAVLDRHDMLRARVVRGGMEVAPPGTIAPETVLVRVPCPDIDRADAESVIEAAAARLAPDAGVMVAATWLDPGSAAAGRLVLVIHHLAVDAVSWRILIADLISAWAQARADETPELPSVGTSMRTWAHALTTAATTEPWTGEADYWSAVLTTPDPPLGRRALDPAVDTGDTLDRLELSLPAATTATLLDRLPVTYRCGMEEALLAALASALAAHRAEPGPALVMLERHGRDEAAIPGADLSRTVGWFTSQFPVRLDIGDAGPLDALAAVKEQLRAVPRGGIGFGLLRHSNPQTAAVLGAAPPPQLGFNYLGQVAEGDADATENAVPWLPVSLAASLGGGGGAELPASAVLAVDAVVVDGPKGSVLQAVWRYASMIVDSAEMEALAGKWISALEELARRVAEPDAGRLTPSDLPLVSVGQRQLDAWAARYPAMADVWPLAPLQQGLLFHTQLSAGRVDEYSVQAVFEFDGDVDIERLAAAATATVRGHEALRTAFVAGVDEPVQIVLADVEVPWRTVEVDPADFDAFAARELAAPFDPAHPPLVRFVCVRCGADDIRLLVTNHHLVLDGWSMPLLLAELLARYETGGDGSGFPPSVSYRNYLEWLTRRDRAAAMAAWTDALGGLPGPSLVTAGRAPLRTGSGKLDLELPLTPESALALQRMAADQGVTLNTVVQCAWGMLLAELTGATDIVFGATVSGRPADLPGAERIVGMLVNTLPVRIALDPAEPVGDLLRRVQREQGALLDHHTVGLNEIQSATGLGVLFDTAIVYESYPVDAAALRSAAEHAALRVRDFRGRDGTHYPLSLAAHARDTLRLILSCATGFFDAAEAHAIGARLVRMLDRMAADPAGQAAAVSGVERADVMCSRPQPMRLLPELLRSGVRPGRVAIHADTVALDYAELDARSNRLARKLIAAGAGAETRVLLALPRSVDWFVAVWAIAKSGAAFVPVDIDHPEDRLAALATDSAAALGVTTAEHRDRLPDTVSWLLLDDPALRAELPDHSDAPVTDADRLRPLRAEHPAYLIYTSGSTGTPKGVTVTHAGLGGLAVGTAARMRARPGDRVLLSMNPNFDAATLVWLSTFYTGATLVVAPAAATAGDELTSVIVANEVTHVIAPPAVLATLSTTSWNGVRAVVTGGEVCPPELTARVGAGRSMMNSYGPAEATVAATFSAALVPGEVADLGAPMPGFGLVVLDRWLRPAPVGTVGELYLMGPGLARGYHGRTDLTAARFVPTPFGAPGDRMYRTGDLVRRVSQNRLEYVGRNDSQVKLHGIRVEPGEVDTVLRAVPGVAMAVTVPRRGPTGDLALAAYVAPAAGAELDAARLRDQLVRRLPRHLVPAAVTVLDVLPVTGNGKVDVRALPEPESVAVEYVAPIGVERVVAEVFGAVLDRPGVGAFDDFFALGGDSLSATRVTARLGAALDIQIPVRLLFEAPTVRALAARLPAAGDGARPSIGPRSGPRPERIPLAPAQQRMWFVNQYDPASGAYNIPAVLRLRGDLNVAALRSALSDVLARHEALRTVYPARDGVGYQVVLPPDALELDPEPTAITADELPAAVMDCVTTGFDVAAEVPLRLRLFRVAADEHVLVVVVHHISADGFSMGPLARDVLAAYAARSHGAVPEWTELPVQYADYTLWQRERLGSSEDPASMLACQLDYWTTTLSGLPDRLELPADRPRPAIPSLRAGTVLRTVDAEVAAALDELGRANQSSLFMVLHATLAALFAKLSGTPDIAIGTPVAGRGAAELDDVVGMFVNTVVLRTEIDSAASFSELLARTRRTDLDAFAHADIPFESLVDVLDPARSAARHPLVQVMLVFQNLAPVELTLPDLHVAAVELEQQSLRFDLSVTVAPDETSGLTVRFGYATDLFDHDTVDRLADRWLRLLRAVVAHPEAPVGDVDLLGPEERTALAIPACPSMAEPVVLSRLLADAAAANPDEVAVIDGITRLTYRELDEHANRLARVLIGAGAGPEGLVAIAIRRSLDAVLAVWAVAKTGAAFVPIDPAYPAERITQILDDSGARLGVTVREVAPSLPGSGFGDSAQTPGEPPVHWLALDDPGTTDLVSSTFGAAIDAAELTAPVRWQNPAYVIFTSGSTGRPKGVIVTHEGLANLTVAQRDRMRITAGSRVLAVASPSFDAAVLELLMAVGAGATLVIAGPTAYGGPELGELLARERVSHIALTPSALGSVDAAALGPEPALRGIITGGEPCPPELVEQWAAPDRLHFNDYGPTEATIWATGSQPLRPGDEITIGGPAPGLAVRVLDERLHPVPDGVVGELYLSGHALARGYHGRSALTAARFVADPYGTPGERMYRTGDLVRRRDGALDYLGRGDLQVKLRGLRIELGEIESALASDPAVHQAAVTVYTDPSVGELLVGYVVPHAVGSNETKALDAAMHDGEVLDAEVRGADAHGVEEFDAEAREAGVLDAEAREAEVLDAEAREAEVLDVEAREAGALGVDERAAEAADAGAREAEVLDAEAREAEVLDVEAREAGALGVDERAAEAADAGAREAEVLDAEAREAEVLDVEAREAGALGVDERAAEAADAGAREAEVLDAEAREAEVLDVEAREAGALGVDERAAEAVDAGAREAAALDMEERQASAPETRALGADAQTEARGVEAREAGALGVDERAAEAVDAGAREAAALDIEERQANAPESGALGTEAHAAKPLDAEVCGADARGVESHEEEALETEASEAGVGEAGAEAREAEALDAEAPDAGELGVEACEAEAADAGAREAATEAREAEAVEAEVLDAEAHGVDERAAEAVDAGARAAEALGREALEAWTLGVEALEAKALDVGALEAGAQKTEAEAHDAEAVDAAAGEAETVDAAARGAEAVDAEVQDVETRDAEPSKVATIDLEALKTSLAQRLPSYMVPSALVVLDALPRTANGKLDRRALPAPDIRAGRFREPNSPAERVVAETFGELLGVARVGLDDNFFALGGNSLIATRIAARLGAALDTRVPVRMVFDAPTVAELAEAVRTAAAAPGPRPGPRHRPARVPLSAAQRRMWFLNRYDPASPAHNVPIAVEVEGELDPAILQGALMDVLARHEALRTVYPVDADGEPYQDVRGLAEAYVPVRISDADPETVPGRVAAAIAKGFDLTVELPIRVSLLRLGPRRTVLVVVMHHIASDGWSLAPLTRDVMVAFATRRAGAAPQWSPLPLQYADYALWQNELLGADDDPDSVAHRQLEYWRGALDGLPDVSTLPSDHPRPTVSTHRAGTVDFHVDAAVQQRIRQLCRWHGVSIFMVAHAALAVLLGRLSEEQDVAIGSVIAGRGDGELDELVGMFVNTLVLRSRVRPDDSFETLLAATKDSDLDAFGNADLPFERLVELLAPARSTAHHPLFQVLLVFQNFEREPGGLPDLDVRPLEMLTVGAKFDLEWMLAEQFDEEGAPAGMRGTLTFALDLFEQSTAQTFADRYIEVLDAVTANPGLLLGELDVTAPPGTVVYEPPPNLTQPRTDLPYRPPVTRTEQAVVSAFETVLDADRVGLDDNFFELGGTSMVAIRLVTELRERLGETVPVQWMFGDPTPGALAQRIVERREAGPDGVDPALLPLLPMRPSGSGPALFCVHPAIGLAWGYAGLVRHLDPGHPVYGLQSPGVAAEQPDMSLTERAARYADEMQAVQPDGPYRVLGYSAGGPLAHAVAVELQRRGATVSALVIIDGRADVEPESATEMPPPEVLLAEFGGIDPDLLAGDQPLAERAAELLRGGENALGAGANGALGAGQDSALGAVAAGALGALDAAALQRLRLDYQQLVRQAAEYRPGVFDGDVLFFSSTSSRPGYGPNVDTWRPYVGGAILDRQTGHEHNRLTRPEALAVIGPILAEYLRERG